MKPVFLKRLARVALGALALGAAGCNSLFYYPTRRVYVDPSRLGIEHVDHHFPMDGGLKLHGRVFRHAAGQPYQGLFVLFHGNAENLTSHFMQFAWVLERGYDLFVFDYAGYGASEGKATRASTLASGRAALDFLSGILPSRDSRLVLVGASLGGAILLHCLPEWKDRDRVTLAVVESGFDSYRKVARRALSRHILTWPLQPLAYLVISEEGSPGSRIAALAPTPLLLATCKEDPVVDARFSGEIFARAKEPKWLWEFPPCRHIRIFRDKPRQEMLLGLVDSLHSSRAAGGE